MSRAVNYFGVLDDDDEDAKPTFALAPSILAASAPEEMAAALAVREPAVESAGVLSSATADLLASLDEIKKPLPEATWDFSGLAATATDAEKRMAAEAEARRTEMEKSLAAKAAAEDAYMKERLAIQRSGVSHKQRVKHVKDVEKGESFAEKFTSKVSRTDLRRKARNRAKHSPY